MVGVLYAKKKMEELAKEGPLGDGKVIISMEITMKR